MSSTADRNYLPHDKSLIRRMFFSTEAGLIVGLIVVAVLACAFVPNFGTPITLTYILLNNAPILLMVLPMTLIVITGEIDLSVGSTFGISSVALGLLYDAHVPLPAAAFVCLLLGAAIGLLNGFMVTIVGLPSLAVTIGTLALVRGVAVGLLGTTAITDFPISLSSFAQSNIGSTPVPLITIVLVVLGAAFFVLLKATSVGRAIYATGLGLETARFSGVDVRRTKLALFVASGVVAAFAGLFFTVQYDNSIGSNGVGLELQVVTAVVLGGVSIFGGRGSVLGAVVGALLIGLLSQALQLASVGSNGINIVTGTALILSVVVSSVVGVVSRRRRGRASTQPGGSA